MVGHWPIVNLADVLQHRKHFIRVDDLRRYTRCRVQLHAQGVVLRDQVDGAEIKTKAQQVCRAGEFLVAEIDAKHGGYGLVPDDLDGAIVSSHYFLFEIDQARLDRKFLGYFCKTPTFADQVAAQGSTNYAAIRPSHVLHYKIPLPPIAEQQRIVARIEELAATVAEARHLRQDATSEFAILGPASLGTFFRSMVNMHPVHHLRELTSCITDGPHKTPQYVDDGIPFVTVKNMVSGHLDFGNLRYITRSDHEDISRRCKPECGDVLYSKDGATRGVPCLVDTDREFNIFVSVALIKPLRNRLIGRYLVHLLNSQWIKDQVAEHSRGDTIPHIVLGKIRQFPIPLPPLSEQQRIVAYLDGLSAKADALKKLQESTAAELDALLPSILDKAFKGKL